VLALANSVVYFSAALGAAIGAVLLRVVPLIRLPFVALVFYVLALIAFVSAGRYLQRAAQRHALPTRE